MSLTPVAPFDEAGARNGPILARCCAREHVKRPIFASTMKELINIIVQKTGISEENAQKAVQVMLGFLKTKLPAPLAGQLDSFLSARTTSGVNPVAVGAKA